MCQLPFFESLWRRDIQAHCLVVFGNKLENRLFHLCERNDNDILASLMAPALVPEASPRSRRSLDKHERPVARASQIAKETVDQKPQRHPSWNVAVPNVMPWFGNHIVRVP